MDALQLHAALCDHVARDGRVDTAGEQHHGSAAHAGRQAARARVGRPVHIGGMVTHLDIDRVLRVMHVNADALDRFGDASADLLRNADTRQREALVGALGLDLEGRGGAQVVPEVFHGRLEDRVEILFARAAAAEADHAEDIVAGLPRAVKVAQRVLRLDVDRGLADIHAELAEGAHPPRDVGLQPVFKLEFVAALEDDLA